MLFFQGKEKSEHWVGQIRYLCRMLCVWVTSFIDVVTLRPNVWVLVFQRNCFAYNILAFLGDVGRVGLHWALFTKRCASKYFCIFGARESSRNRTRTRISSDFFTGFCFYKIVKNRVTFLWIWISRHILLLF